jgi:hypothetical protein
VFSADTGRKAGEAVNTKRNNASPRKIDKSNLVFIEQTPCKEAPSEAGQVRVFSKPSESKLRIRLLPTLAKQ